MKSNSESVVDYQRKLTSVMIRFPNAESCGIDYLKLIRERAKELGFIVAKGKEKGQGSVNAYILHLIEQDLDVNMTKTMTAAKKGE